MLYQVKPKEFNPKFEVVSCFLESGGKILLLHRQDNKPQGNTWGVPAGKIDLNEDKIIAIVREIKEETSIIVKENDLIYFDNFFVSYLDFDFIYHIFHCKLENKPNVKINLDEHKAHLWEYPNQALNLPLIQDEDECIKRFYGIN